jgi:serine/threonine protein kinase
VRYFVTLDARAAELSARHTPQAPPAWVANLAGATLRLVDADCRIDIRHAAGDEEDPWLFSLLVENRVDYARWKAAFELVRRGGRALRQGGPVDKAFRKHYSLEPVEVVKKGGADETSVARSPSVSSAPSGRSQQECSTATSVRGSRQACSNSTEGPAAGPQPSATVEPQLLPNNDESEPLMMRCWEKGTGEECVATRVLSQRSPAALSAARLAAQKRGVDLPLVPLLHTFQRNGAAIEVSPAYPLGTLGTLLERSEPLPIAQVIRLCRDMFTAISCLHDAQLVHRAIAPQNFFIHATFLPSSQRRADSRGQLSLDQELPAGSSSETTLRAMLGRFDYVCGASDILPEEPGSRVLPMSPTLAPEVLLCEQYGAAGDMWASGTVLFRMLTGKLPFEAPSHLELFRAIERVDFAFKAADLTRIPAAAIDLVQNLLVRLPGDRLTARQALRHPFLSREQAAAPAAAMRISAGQSRIPAQVSPLAALGFSRSAPFALSLEDHNDGQWSIGSTSDDLEAEERPGQIPRRLPQGFRKTYGTLRRRRHGDEVGLPAVCSLTGLGITETTDAGQSYVVQQLPPALPRSLTESEGDIGAALLARLDYQDYNPSPVSGQSPVLDSEMDDSFRHDSWISAPRLFDAQDYDSAAPERQATGFLEMQSEGAEHDESTDACTVWDVSFDTENANTGADLSLSARLPDREPCRSAW